MTLAKIVRSAGTPLVACLLLSFALSLSAQDPGPPKVLVIAREFTKPGKGGALHEKTEGAFIHAMAAAKNNSHYIAMTSLSGVARALFFTGYDSFAAWEAENKAVYGDATVSAALDRANAVDGDLLTSADVSVWTQRPDQSNNPGNMAGVRYMDITQIVIRPGHQPEWEELQKLVSDGYKKSIPDIGWVTYEQTFGTAGGTVLIISSLKSMADIDRHVVEGKGFMEALGGENMKKMASLEASAVESEQDNLFMLSPKLSYPTDAMVKADPEFWKLPKVPAPAKKPEK